VYAHVPHGYTGDATTAIEQQIERFAPGFAATVLARHVTTPSQFEVYNANYVGGDIMTGANTPFQTMVRPRLALDPYATGAPGLYICSASTPPGAGAHGMGGYGAALSALRSL
jgi:phytoene dehydrogenase-like protein